MKLIHAVAFTGLCLVTGANAFAQTTQSGLTRAEVRAQLIQAEKDASFKFSMGGLAGQVRAPARRSEYLTRVEKAS